MTDYMDNIEIDLFDLVRFILKKWKILLMATVIGAILGGVYISLFPTKEDTSVMEDEVDPSSKLTNKEKSDVDLAYRAYMQCLDLYDQMEEKPDEIAIDLRIELIKATQQILGASSSFSSDQKTYYASLFEDLASNKVKLEPVASTNKCIAVGTFTGLFLAVLGYCLKYIFSPTLRTVDDLRGAFQLPIIGIIDCTNDQIPAIIVSSVAACAKNAEAHALCLVTDSDNAHVIEIQNKVINMLEEKEGSVKSKGIVITDSNAIEDIAASNGVILFAKIWKSRYADIARELELCRNSGTPIMGAVVIR